MQIKKQQFLVKLDGKNFLNVFGHLVCYECGYHQAVSFLKGDFLEIKEEHAENCKQK